MYSKTSGGIFLLLFEVKPSSPSFILNSITLLPLKPSFATFFISSYTGCSTSFIIELITLSGAISYWSLLIAITLPPFSLATWIALLLSSSVAENTTSLSESLISFAIVLADSGFSNIFECLTSNSASLFEVLSPFLNPDSYLSLLEPSTPPIKPTFPVSVILPAISPAKYPVTLSWNDTEITLAGWTL